MGEAESGEVKREFAVVYRTQPAFKNEPFDSSAIDYEPLSQRVERVLSILESGVVLAIDAPWGSGKTYFGTNFQSRLDKQGWCTCYVDAFRGEYVEDPFLLLASAVREQVASGTTSKQKSFTNAAAKVGKALLPIVGKALVRVASANLVSVTDIKDAEKALTDAATQASEKLITDQLAAFDKDRKSFEAFKKELTDFAGDVMTKTGHPLVVLVDELDRCPPPFAIRLLERVKHFFDVPHLSFVLLLDRQQLERAVHGVYGAGIDADAYLRKFVHLTLPMPKRAKSEHGRSTEVQQYIDYLMKSVDLGNDQPYMKAFAEALSHYAPGLQLSLRDVERCYTQFIVAIHSARVAQRLVGILTFLVAVRVKQPDTYRILLNRETGAMPAIQQIIEQCVQAGCSQQVGEFLLDVCNAHTGGEVVEGGDRNQFARFVAQFNTTPERLLWILARLVDPLPDR